MYASSNLVYAVPNSCAARSSRWLISAMHSTPVVCSRKIRKSNPNFSNWEEQVDTKSMNVGAPSPGTKVGAPTPFASAVSESALRYSASACRVESVVLLSIDWSHSWPVNSMDLSLAMARRAKRAVERSEEAGVRKKVVVSSRGGSEQVEHRQASERAKRATAWMDTRRIGTVSFVVCTLQRCNPASRLFLT